MKNWKRISTNNWSYVHTEYDPFSETERFITCDDDGWIDADVLMPEFEDDGSTGWYSTARILTTNTLGYVDINKFKQYKGDPALSAKDCGIIGWQPLLITRMWKKTVPLAPVSSAEAKAMSDKFFISFKANAKAARKNIHSCKGKLVFCSTPSSRDIGNALLRQLNDGDMTALSATLTPSMWGPDVFAGTSEFSIVDWGAPDEFRKREAKKLYGEFISASNPSMWGQDVFTDCLMLSGTVTGRWSSQTPTYQDLPAQPSSKHEGTSRYMGRRFDMSRIGHPDGDIEVRSRGVLVGMLRVIDGRIHVWGVNPRTHMHVFLSTVALSPSLTVGRPRQIAVKAIYRYLERNGFLDEEDY